MSKLFVAFSHTLTPDQKEGWDNVITLAEVAPELQAHMSQIPANETLANIKLLASLIVAEAVKAEATHFFCVGEPTLTWWANLYASKYAERLESNRLFNLLDEVEWEEYCREMEDAMTCIQSTTERKSSEVVNPDGTVRKVQIFSHVQWREMF